MKKLLFLLAFAIPLLGFAQKVKDSDVPAAVKNKFASLYPNIKAKWEKEGANYEAEFEQNETETSVVFDASGNLLETETEIAISSLPAAVSEYFAKNYNGAKITEASKIVAADGTITYEAETKDGDFLFDANGNFIKKDVDEHDDKDEEKDKD